jgi:hypothetical protein
VENGHAGIFQMESRKMAPGLARVSHKDHCERPERAVNAGVQRQKAHRYLKYLKYFEDAFWGCNPAGMVLSGLAADRL